MTELEQVQQAHQPVSQPAIGDLYCCLLQGCKDIVDDNKQYLCNLLKVKQAVHLHRWPTLAGLKWESQ
jgi:hypothetical protein